MGFRAHVQVKHEIEYGRTCYFNWSNSIVAEWLENNGVPIYGVDEYHSGDEWEIYKDDLKSLPDSCYHDIHYGNGYIIEEDELREFVKDLIEAPTGDYVYVSWF